MNKQEIKDRINILKQELDELIEEELKHKSKGKFDDLQIEILSPKAILLRGGINKKSPTKYMNDAVNYIVNILGNPSCNTFVESYLDNPYVRIIIFDINDFDYADDFDDIRKFIIVNK